MTYKKSRLIVDNCSYVYTVKPKPHENVIKITVYQDLCKQPYFVVYFTYTEAWGFDVYRPKTIELLIRFYRENYLQIPQNVFRVKTCQELFQMLMEYFFADSSIQDREWFVSRCKVFF